MPGTETRDNTAAYAAALRTARDTGASQIAASIAATQAVARVEDEDAGTDSEDKGKDAPEIEVLPATGGVSPLIAAGSIIMVVSAILLVCAVSTDEHE